MRKLLNVLYVTSPDAYLSLEGETIVIKRDNQNAVHLPLHNIENILCFGYTGASPALMAACAERNIGIVFLSPHGRFLARVIGKTKGNVLLRKRQYLLSEEKEASVQLALSFLIGKIYNSRKVIERATRDHALVVDVGALNEASVSLKVLMRSLKECQNINDLMGFEGSAARVYFGVFNHLILHQKQSFFFTERSRRPPLDNLNALLSFFYTILASEVSSALESVGLDPYVGFLHQDRPGRPSLALDLMEELRPIFADRLALTIINRKQINADGFYQKESGGIIMDDTTKKTVLTAWQEKKKEEIMHPFLREKIEFGLIPYVQALLLARYIRGDLDAYPPYFWS